MKKTDKVEKKDTVAEEVKEKDTAKTSDADKKDTKGKKEKKVKKDKATRKAEKAEKKAARKAQRKEDRKNPEIKAAKKAFAIKIIAALVCAFLISNSISTLFTKYAELIKVTEPAKIAAASSAGTGASGNGSGSLADTQASTPSQGGQSSDAGSSEQGGETAEPAPQPGEKDESGKPVKPQDGVATLEYFNTAINKVKTGATSIDQKKVENYLASSPTIPSALNGIYKMLGGDSWLDKMLKDNSQGAATLKGGDIKAKFPVEGESYASQLQPSDVKAATCTEADGIYTITITTLPDAKSSGHKHGAGHNPKALNVILPSTVNENIPGAAKGIVGEAAMAYPSSTITITVDAETGNVLTASYDLKWTISFTKMNAAIPLGTRSVYEIKW